MSLTISKPEAKTMTMTMTMTMENAKAAKGMEAMEAKESEMRRLVLMAACNGEAYIEEQTASILPQLERRDFLLVSLDPSTDQTAALLGRMKKRDERILLFDGPGKGVTKNFEFLLQKAEDLIVKKKMDPERTLIFLCDQDDVWQKDKVKRCEREMEEHKADLLVHDAAIIDENGVVKAPSFMKEHQSRPGFWPNVIRNSFIGCCMVFRANAIKDVLPFPSPLPMHDQWIGLQISRSQKTIWLKEPLLLYRRHQNNASSMKHAGALLMARWRLQILRALFFQNRSAKARKRAKAHKREREEEA